MKLFWHQLRSEQLLFWRSREAAVFTFIFPLLLFTLLGSVYEGTSHGYRVIDLLLVGMLGYGAGTTAFAGLSITLVVRREGHLLKRLRATPLPPAVYFASLLVSTLFVFALQAVVLVAIGRFLFDARTPDRLGSLAVALLLGAGSFAAIGLGAAALIRSAEGSSAVVNLILLPMAFLSGGFGPTGDYPRVLRAFGDVLPLKYVILLARSTALDGRHVWAHPGWIGVVVAWGLAGLAVAFRRFGWEPREAV